MELKALPLAAARDAGLLAPYLTLIEGEHGTRLTEPFAPADAPADFALTILSPKPIERRATITALERHPHSNQSFIPLNVGRWLILVAPNDANGGPDMARALAFVAGPSDAICIHQNVWHAGLTVWDSASHQGPARFAMMMWQAHAGDDGELFTLPEAASVDLS